MNPIVINGTVLCDPITGIPRFVYEVVTRLDPLLEGTGLEIVHMESEGKPIPPGANLVRKGDSIITDWSYLVKLRKVN